jgi:hypothetical protein
MPSQQIATVKMTAATAGRRSNSFNSETEPEPTLPRKNLPNQPTQTATLELGLNFRKSKATEHFRGFRLLRLLQGNPSEKPR